MTRLFLEPGHIANYDNTQTTNKMTVVAGAFGSTRFAKAETLNSFSSTGTQSATAWASSVKSVADFGKAIIQSVAINSTAFETQENGQAVFLGSKTETALLQWAKDHLALPPLTQARSNETTVEMFPFDPEKKCMGAVIRHGSSYRLLVKGASEILLEYCSSMVEVRSFDLEHQALTQDDRVRIRQLIDCYASQSLRTIGLIYQDYAQWPPASASLNEDGKPVFQSLLSGLTFLGVVGIQDPVRDGVPEAVKKAQDAGVIVRMVTGDNITTAKAIATECGIFTDGLVMEGPVFRSLTDEQINNVLPRLQVLARSSPEDKRILVVKLKGLGNTVAVTGDGTNDAPALKAADVGFSMGTSGTEVAKEASSIVLMDDNFTSIITALKWGRAVNDAVQKFLQASLGPPR